MSIFSRSYDMSLLRTTSKDALKRSLIELYGDDYDKMSKIYDFYMKDMKDVPDFDNPNPSTFDNIKESAANVLGWADKNQSRIIEIINMVQQLRGKAGITIPASIPADVPPIP